MLMIDILKLPYNLLSWRQRRDFKQLSVMLSLLLALLSLLGCSGNTTPALPTPVGATSGLNTFIFFYTDT